MAPVACYQGAPLPLRDTVVDETYFADSTPFVVLNHGSVH